MCRDSVAGSRLIPPLDRLISTDYDTTTRTAATRKQEETLMPFYEKGDVRIHYEEAGSGFPLLVIPGGGLNSTIEGLKTHPFNPFDEFANEFRVIAADLRNAKGGQSTGPLETGRAWEIGRASCRERV